MFSAAHASVDHTITLPLSADEVFPLFTPEGERLWIADWNPHYFYPANGETLVGMVFTTGHGDEVTYWTLVDLDMAAHFARYSRVTPGSRSVFVEVYCRAVSERETEIKMHYTLTALSEAGNTTISAFVSGFPAMIDDWKVRILAYLDRSKVSIHP